VAPHQARHAEGAVGLVAVTADVPAAPLRPLTWLELRCTSCGARHDVILERCLVDGFPPCRAVHSPVQVTGCGGEMAVFGQPRVRLVRNAEGLLP